MESRIMEVLVQLAEYLHHQPPDMADVEAVTETLSDQGYTTEEINTALLWLFQMVRPSSSDVRPEEKAYLQPLTKNFRVLDAYENLILTPMAHGYLIQLKELGLINDTQIELVLERVLMANYTEIDLDDMKKICTSVLFDPFGLNLTGSRLIFENFIEGSEQVH